MRLSARAILTFNSVNSFSYGNQWIVRSGDPNTLYFQLVDLDQTQPLNIPGQPLLPGSFKTYPPLRYLAGIGLSNQPYSVYVTFPSIDDAKVITAVASQADVNDSSIWKVSLSSLQTPNSGNVRFSVSEGSNTRSFNVLNLISVEFPQNDGCDGTIPNNNSTSFA